MNKFSRTKARLERRHDHAAKSYFPSIHARRPGVVFPTARGWAARATTKKAHSSLRFENGDAAFNRALLDKLNKPETAIFLATLAFASRDPSVKSPKIQTA